MTRPIMCTIALVAAIAPSVEAAGDVQSMTELPVAAMRLVAPAEYREASALASRGGLPLDVALRTVGRFEGSVQDIVQVNDRGDSPSVTRVTVMRDGLLDDSVRGDRWEITLERTSSGIWRIREVKRAWRCWRGEARERLAIEPCR